MKMEKEKPLVFNRSKAGTYRKFNEAIKILEYSVMLVELFKLKEFNNVIAGQLRLILCDTSIKKVKGGDTVVIDNSLLPKINFSPKLHPVRDFVELSKEGNAFIPGELFDYTKPMIDLKTWRYQVIYKISLGDKFHEITIFDFIKESANKSGGAHLDSSLPEKSFIVDVHSEQVLTYIARGLFRSIGRDFEAHSLENLTHIIREIEQAKAATE
ncbi:hypothetical protein ACIP97_18030 [Peribacillus frigoritolerans]|uniref:hypothetical protein n=1 Tax=Peribacillus frigoritolerans TaxID=450367 RepID=UPI00382775D6